MDRTLPPAVAVLFIFTISAAHAGEGKDDLIVLNQAWSKTDRQAYYQTSQGSAAMSYDIFLNLEVADGSGLFRSDANLAAYGLIPQAPDPVYNPDGLPIGVTKSSIRDGSFKGDWLGLTCAACHTGQLDYKGKQIRIDGGVPHLFDFMRLAEGLDDALQATLSNDGKLDRLAARMKAQDKDALQQRLASEASAVQHYRTRSLAVPTRFGPGRIDALGLMHNEVTANLTKIPENWYPALAPVKPPFLWNAPQSAWVQWSGTFEDPIVRNAGEATGVFARVDTSSPTPAAGRYDSTLDIAGLDALEKLLRRLAPPKWPEAVFGAIDQKKAARGKQLFAESCAQCHTSWPYRWSEAKKAGKRFIENAIVSFKTVGTDPSQFSEVLFATRDTVIPGAYSRGLPPPFKDRSVIPAAVLYNVIAAAVREKAIAKANLTPEQTDDLHGYRPYGSEPAEKPPVLGGYKASPLDGVWATAPFLHNGSVPNLYELLRPAKERQAQFNLGRGFDPVKVGVETSEQIGTAVFNTALPGNSNAGHSFEDGPRVNGVIGRLLADDERWALIEYMKSIPEEAGRVTPYGGPDTSAAIK
jgi:cytochrome c2